MRIVQSDPKKIFGSLIPTVSKIWRSNPRKSSQSKCNNLPCHTCHHVFIWRKHSLCMKWLRRMTWQKDARKSAMCWLLGFCRLMMSTFKSTITMASFPGNSSNTYYRSGRYSRLDGGKNSPMRMVWYLMDTISQLTTFSPWKHVDSTLHPYGRSLTARPTPRVLPRS